MKPNVHGRTFCLSRPKGVKKKKGGVSFHAKELAADAEEDESSRLPPIIWRLRRLFVAMVIVKIREQSAVLLALLYQNERTRIHCQYKTI